MNSRIRLAIIGLAIGLGMSTPVLAADNGPNMEQRLQRIERMLQNQSLADLVLQLQQLQREVQQLRGDVE
ncbi:MAG: tol-pal system protein YbgF, partial [Candidatus Thiodiazotropha sp. (ex. Lucinisca nassula)]|nr:tol-pal system protein YbgF [Candidatus Thiodiazotropha sp. (ex. Lucinisca nassula)]